jgi:NlpC/P60 family putative phage cell wall peptidase
MRNIDDTRQAVVAEARGWIGTPYQHQARVRQVGTDCVGLIVGVGIAAGVLEWSAEAFAPWRGYGRLPNPRKMREGLERFLIEIEADQVRPGDIPWFAWREGRPMHLGIMATDDTLAEGRPTIIHATSLIGRVVEHGFAGEWPDRVEGWWRYPGLA